MKFRTWDELTTVEKLQCEYSDAYKDRYNFRPRGMTPEEWNSEEWLTDALEQLYKIPLSN